ncbi:hypothetical protein HCCG_02093 [Helicobacter cinaedi CCUG 18818 = ATCC BAA-847]|uniref:Uncharacterized protein n=1 Tax=Helicobacter cinaedi CCUG 18818 = ATCC BAA-847 TaxID=537971 RepID=A0ABN0BDF6_9HELI|nr:hypothetical protein HCCG_02093 [Helicobacter cinaedi CCUG 18818 = ATCC BAA-847]
MLCREARAVCAFTHSTCFYCGDGCADDYYRLKGNGCSKLELL